MPNLRTHAKDPAIGAVTQQNLERIADILDAYAKRLKHPILKYFYRDRKDALTIELLAATFSRVKGIPDEVPAQFDAVVRLSMDRRDQ